jgi:transcriptional regulator with XRE-family HTH domain
MAGMERPLDSSQFHPRRPTIRRAGQLEVLARRRARVVAGRAGYALRDARLSVGLTQAEIGRRSGLSQVHISRLEHGAGAESSLDIWSRVAAAVGEQLVAYLDHAPGSDLPRDIQHLRRQSAVVLIATKGEWKSLPEFSIDPGSRRSRSIDVALVRQSTREAVVVEIWDWFDDVGTGLRSLDGKVAALANLLARQARPGEPGWRVRALYVVRDTRRNRRLVAELAGLFKARFRGNSQAWLKALTDPRQELPEGDGFLWSDRTGSALRPSRLG